MSGLIQSLEAQDRTAEAQEVQESLNQVWALADVELTGSRMD